MKPETPTTLRCIPLTLGVAARELGFPGERRTAEMRLRRYLRRREVVLGVEIMQMSVGPRQARYTVTMSQLREHCPELFNTRSEAEELLCAQVEEIEDRLAALQRQDEALAATMTRALAAKATVDVTERNRT